MIPGSGRSSGEGIGYPLQYSWASLVAQLVKNLPAMRETRVQSLGWEDPLEKGMATHSSILVFYNEHNSILFSLISLLGAVEGHSIPSCHSDSQIFSIFWFHPPLYPSGS